MSETYTESELARAWGEVDSILGEDYRNERLAKICLQARKNRLWEAHGNDVSPLQDTAARFGFDLAEEEPQVAENPPWERPETSEPIVFTADGPIPFSKVPEKLKKAVLTKDLDEPTAAG